jgi:membrane protease YdiL (CAAX protease family)
MYYEQQARGALANLISRFPLASFFVMAFLFSWIAVTPLLLDRSLPIEPFQVLGALAGPTVSALIVTGVIEGGAGLRAFLKRYAQWRAGVIWWLFVLFGLLIALNVAAAIIIGPTILSEFFGNIAPALITYATALIAGVILGPLWEEPGWRGFALPRLQRQFGSLVGTVILGLLWALWHLPGYFGGWMTAGVLPLLVSSVAFSIIATWVYNNTAGSILLMILLHASSNAAIALGARVLPADLSESLRTFVFSGWIPAITYAVLALLILLATRGAISWKRS